MMRKLKLIRQHDEKDCGAACLAMIADYYGLKLPLATVREAIKVDQHGASIFGMIEGSETFGLRASAFEGDPDLVWTEIKNNPDISQPSVIRVLNEKGFEHYVVVHKIRKNIMGILDPDIGKCKISKEEFEEIFLGNIICYEVAEGFQPENRKKGSLRRFTDMIFRQKRLLAWISVLSLIVTGIGISGTFVFQHLIDKVLPAMESTASPLNSFGKLIVCLLGLYALKFLIQLLRGKIMVTMSKNIDLPLMLGCYDHTTKLPLSFFETRKTGEILSRFNDAGEIRNALSNATLTVLIDLVLCVTCAIVMFRTSSLLFVVAMATFILYAMISLCYIRPLDRMNYNLMEIESKYQSFLKESVDLMETLKTSQGEEGVRTKNSMLFHEYLKKSITGSMLSLSRESLVEFVEGVSSLSLLWFGALCIMNGSMSIGSLVTFSTMLGYFLSPVQNLVDLQENIQTALVAADRLNDILDLDTERSDGVEPEGSLRQVDFDHVAFRYGTRNLVLEDFNLSMRSGEHVALVGASGCGKSTAAKLLQGLYTPESGQVSINNIPTESISLQWLREKTAFVPQTNQLFSDTIRNNLVIGCKQIPTDEELVEILSKCECGFVMEMPMGLDSTLEENGANLSGGQRQRLAIARSLIRKPDLLILDEATSALDTVTENRVLNAIRTFHPDMMILMIAHRLSTVQHCDRILVVDHGCVVENGTHRSLLENKENTRYAELWKMQNARIA